MLLLTCAVVLVGLLVALPDATATSVTSRVSPSADAYVNQARPRVNFGSAKELLAGSRPKVRRSYLRFDLANLSGTVVKATLRLYSKDASRTGFAVHAVSDNSWSERTITYQTAPPPGPVVATTPRAAADAFASVDITGLVGAAGGVVGLAVTAADRLRVASRESGALGPQLIVEVASTSTSTTTTTTTTPTTSTSTSTSTTTTTLVQTTTTTTTLPPQPAVSDKLVPREGAWWGSYPGQAAGDVEAREALYGRKVDVLHRYHDWNDVWPTDAEQAYAAQGRFLYVSWENRIFGGNTVCWADVADGSQDAAIDAQAQRLAAFGQRLFVGFLHEPEDNLGPCQAGAINDSVADMGSAQEFRAAFRHIVARVRPVAPNVVWVFSVMGHDPASSWTFYPGDDVVDWVAWDAYNWANCAGRTADSWRSFQQIAQGMYGYLDAIGNAKPRMLGEFGSHDDSALGSKDQWLREVPAILRTAMPELKAVVYFDRVDTRVPTDPCTWVVDSSPEAEAGFAAAAADPYFNQPHG
jgi:hypothetical protein